jgi:hypothetical protein
MGRAELEVLEKFLLLKSSLHVGLGLHRRMAPFYRGVKKEVDARTELHDLKQSDLNKAHFQKIRRYTDLQSYISETFCFSTCVPWLAHGRAWRLELHN